MLDFGRTMAAGSPDEIRTNQKVIAAYLGAEAAAGVGGSVLKIEDLTVAYGRVRAVNGLSLHVDEANSSDSWAATGRARPAP